MRMFLRRAIEGSIGAQSIAHAKSMSSEILREYAFEGIHSTGEFEVHIFRNRRTGSLLCILYLPKYGIYDPWHYVLSNKIPHNITSILIDGGDTRECDVQIKDEWSFDTQVEVRGDTLYILIPFIDDLFGSPIEAGVNQILQGIMRGVGLTAEADVQVTIHPRSVHISNESVALGVGFDTLSDPPLRLNALIYVHFRKGVRGFAPRGCLNRISRYRRAISAVGAGEVRVNYEGGWVNMSLVLSRDGEEIELLSQVLADVFSFGEKVSDLTRSIDKFTRLNR